MASKGSHSAGIDALPRWDRANPVAYNYDPNSYSASDYAEFKKARLEYTQKQKAAADKSLKKTLSDFQKFLNNEVKNAGSGNSKSKSEKQAPTRKQLREAVAAGKILSADTPSTCFASLTYEDGVAVAEFYHGGTYEYEMSLDDFIEWAQADSLGQFFNAEIR